MESVEEINSWSNDEILAEIRKLLPPKWTFTETPTPENWSLGVITTGEGPVWQSTEADRRLLLLNTYGWLALRGHKTRHPVWKVRGQEGARGQQRPPPNIPDPPDLDPAEINKLVYDRKPKR